MAAIRQILQRRKAAQNICRITRTMEMISTAKFKSYHRLWQSVSEYHNALARAGYLMVTSDEALEHPLLKENSSGKWAILAIGSSRGLCGSYNSEIFRLVSVHVKRAKAMRKKLDIYTTDCRLLTMFGHYGITPKKVYTNLSEVPTYIQIEDIAGDFISQYMQGELDYLGIVYMRYYSASSQQAQTLTIMPLTELIDDLATRAFEIWPWNLSIDDFHFSPPLQKTVELLAKMIIGGMDRGVFYGRRIKRAFCENGRYEKRDRQCGPDD